MVDVDRAMRRLARANAKLLQRQRLLEAELIEMQLKVMHAKQRPRARRPVPNDADRLASSSAWNRDREALLKETAREVASAECARDEAAVERDTARAELSAERSSSAESAAAFELELEARRIAWKAEADRAAGAQREAFVGLSAAHADERARRLLAERDLRDWKLRAAHVTSLARRRVARAAEREKSARSAHPDDADLTDSSEGGASFPEFPFDITK